MSQPPQRRRAAFRRAGSPERLSGVITRWDGGAAHGFITGDSGGSWFVSRDDIPTGVSELPAGTAVMFSSDPAPAPGKKYLRARMVRPAQASGTQTAHEKNGEPVTAPDPLSWLRQAITERLELARKATQPPWMPEGDDPTDDEIWIDGEDDGWREVICRGPRSHENMLHIAANDPRDVIARCEGELGILEEHRPAGFTAYGEHLCRRCRWDDDEPERDDDAHHWVVYSCRTVRLLAAGYRFHPGYAEAGWGP